MKVVHECIFQWYSIKSIFKHLLILKNCITLILFFQILYFKNVAALKKKDYRK